MDGHSISRQRESIPSRCHTYGYLPPSILHTHLSSRSIIAIVLFRTWKRNKYSKRKRARKAAASPWCHSRERLIRAKRLLQAHHGSIVPKRLESHLSGNMPEFTCECGWRVYGKGAIKHSKVRGNCGDASCKAAIRDGTVYVRPDKADAAGADPAGGKAKPRPTVKSPAAKAAAAPSAKAAAAPKAAGPPASAIKQTRFANDDSWITGDADSDDDEADTPALQQ